MRKIGIQAIAIAVVGAALLTAGCGSSQSGAGSPQGSSSRSGPSALGAASAKRSATATKPRREKGLEVDAGKSIAYAKVPASAPTQSGVVQIAYRNIAIDPDGVRVKVGSTIRWVNYDPLPHNVVSEGGPIHFASRDFGEGGSYQLKVGKTGVIHYECTLEPTTMNGTIEVVS